MNKYFYIKSDLIILCIHSISSIHSVNSFIHLFLYSLYYIFYSNKIDLLSYPFGRSYQINSNQFELYARYDRSEIPTFFIITNIHIESTADRILPSSGASYHTKFMQKLVFYLICMYKYEMEINTIFLIIKLFPL